MTFSLPTAGRLELRIKEIDDFGQEGGKTVEVPWDTDLATTLANSLGIADDYAALTRLAVNDGGVYIPFTQDTPETPVAECSKFKEAQISVTLAPSATSFDENGTIRVADPVDAALNGSSGKAALQVNVAAAVVTAYTDHFLAAGDATLSDGQSSTGNVKGIVNPKAGKVRL
jgi:hypothetical protein